MTKDELAMVFAEVTAKVYSPESRKTVEDKLRREQHLGNTPFDDLVLNTNRELILQKAFLLEVLEKVLLDDR